MILCVLSSIRNLISWRYFYREGCGRKWCCLCHTVASRTEPLPFSSPTPVRCFRLEGKDADGQWDLCISGRSVQQGDCPPSRSRQPLVRWTLSQQLTAPCAVRRLVSPVAPLPATAVLWVLSVLCCVRCLHSLWHRGTGFYVWCVNKYCIYMIVDMCSVFCIMLLFLTVKLWCVVGCSVRLMRDVFTVNVVPGAIIKIRFHVCFLIAGMTQNVTPN